MKTQKYAILRDISRATPVTHANRGFRMHEASVRRAEAPPEPRVEVAALTPRDAADLQRDPMIASIAPSMPIKLVRPRNFVPNAAQPVDIDNITWGVRAVGADRSTFTGAGIKVGILDTGIDKTHKAFQGMNLTEVDYTGDGNGDRDGHGTHCAGTIFGRDVGGKRIGVARGVTDAFIGRIFGNDGSGSGSAAIAQGVHDAVEAGCRVVSMSIGFDFPGYAAQLQEQYGNQYPAPFLASLALYGLQQNLRLFDALGEFIQQRAAMSGEVLLIAASGNESERQGQVPYELPVAPPASATGFVSVGALGVSTNERLDVASFSNTGCFLCGPGVGVLSAKAGTTNGLVAYSGTSMATPHVTGVAALWMEQVSTIPQPPPANIFEGSAPRVMGRLLGTASLSSLVSTFDPLDVGNGLVQAPLMA